MPMRSGSLIRILGATLLSLFTVSYFEAQSSPKRTIHVFVSLADNQNQGIVPVPARLGNGLDASHNLYWGAAAGVKTFFARSPDWALLVCREKPKAEILERCVFKHRNADVYMVAYVGHDGLMDFRLPMVPRKRNEMHRDVIILACASKQYFSEPLRASGAYPLLWTTGLMAPEAYTLKSALDGWIDHESNDQVRE